MKKSIFFLLTGLVLGLTACEDKIDYNGVPQVTPQEPVVSEQGWNVNLEPGMSTGSIVDLDSYANTPQTFIPVATVVAPANLPKGSVISLNMMVNDDKDVIVPLENQNGVYGVTAQAWSDAFRQVYGKSPMPQPNDIQFSIYITIEGQLNRVGSTDTWFSQTVVEVVPIDLNINVEPAYYLLLTNVGDGTIQSAFKMNHVEDKNQYDDPTFSYVYNVPETEGGFQWYVIPESYYEAAMSSGSALVPQEGWLQAADASLMEGDLIVSGNPAGYSTFAGEYLFSINMYPGPEMQPTYNISLAVDKLYVYSNGIFKQTLKTDNFTTFYGFGALMNGFQITTQNSTRRGSVWGQETTADDGKIQKQEGSTPLQNIYSPEGLGLYWLNVNISSLTYTYQYCKTVSLIGVNNDWENDIQLTPSSNYYEWSGTVDFTVEGSEFKFRTNDSWDDKDPNLGGSYDDLVNRGDNLPIPGLGTYKVTLDLSKLPYSCKFTKQ